ncbi:MAG: L-seryl-tRNA(Sec) selenium transferase [Anaerolineaceae bacterium]|nr:L-seryl-tRNA(Sec) selenium transferase [Anaerolineaceae bacterium]
MSVADALRRLPAVDALLGEETARALCAQYGRETTVAALRDCLQQARVALRAGDGQEPTRENLLERAAAQLAQRFRPGLRPVINAGGVILHTNLGRAPLAPAAIQAMAEVGGRYSTLEYDLERGARGSRLKHCEDALCELTGAEAALVVNNNAAALVLLLATLARGREVIISRGQLIEIGGGFRVPEVMAGAGARLVEVGATNRTRLADYENAIGADTALLMRAHASNFRMSGFTEETPLTQLAQLAHARELLLVDDLGSGALLDTADFGLLHEPTVMESLAAGADLVAFSGDKLAGGPQAGIIVGRAEPLAALRRHPLARALRADKLCLAGLSATLDLWLRGQALTQIPIWRMIAREAGALRAVADNWARRLGGEVLAGESAVGGGSLPGATLPTWLLALEVAQPNEFLAGLRAAEPPVIARIADGRVLLDPRTVLPDEEEALLAALEAAHRRVF